MPTSVNMNYKDGVYAFDSASSDLSEKNVLTWMVGRSIPDVPMLSTKRVYHSREPC